MLFLGEDLIDVGLEFGVGFEDFGADAALDGGLDFRLCAGGESGGELLGLVGGGWHVWVRTDSFLNMLAECVLLGRGWL